MDASHFVRVVTDRCVAAGEGAAESLPTILTRACLDVLPVQGAGLSIMSDLRIPVGSTDADATFVEKLQFTLGSGPCLSAARRGRPQTSDEETIAASWPAFHHEMIAKTAIRSTLSLPVTVASFGAALNLYSTDPTAAAFPPAQDVMDSVGLPIGDLTDNPSSSVGGLETELPDWLNTPRVENRLDVWVAVGMVMEHAGRGSADALDSLRAYAYANSRTLDEVSIDIVYDDLAPAAITPDRPEPPPGSGLT